MARRKSSHPFAGESDPNVDISPLIDVAFLLLIYFLVTASLLKQEADLGLALVERYAAGLADAFGQLSADADTAWPRASDSALTG